MNTIAKDTPLGEITLRRYEKPSAMPERELVRKLCLSLGLLQPGDSRDVVVDVFCILLHHRSQKMTLGSDEVTQEVIAYRKKHKLLLHGIAPSNIRRQLRRLRELLLVEKISNDYRIAEFGKLQELFEEKVTAFLLPSIIGRIKEYAIAVDSCFLGQKRLQSDERPISEKEAWNKGNAIFH